MEPDDIEERVTALESQVGDLHRQSRSTEQDAQAARVLAGAADRDVADLGSEVRGFRTEFNEFKGEMLEFKGEMHGFKTDMLEFKTEMHEFKTDMLDFKTDMLEFKTDMLDFKTEMHEFKGEMHEFKGEMREEFANVRAEADDFRRATTTSFNALRQDMNDRFNMVDNGFIEMRAKFDATAAGLQYVVEVIQEAMNGRGENGTAGFQPS